MVSLPTFQANGLHVSVKNTFIDVDDPPGPRSALRSSSTPPSFSQMRSERSNTEADSDGSYSDVDDGSTDRPESFCAEELEDRFFPDTDDEREACSPQMFRQAPRAEPAYPSPLGGAGSIVVGLCCPPVVNVIVCPSVPSYRDAVIVASDPSGARPRPRRCPRCRGRKGENCPCASNQAESSPPFAPAALAPALPRSHAHDITVKNVLVDAEKAPRALAETTLKVSCAGGHEGIVVERVVQRSPLSGKAREWLAARGAAGPAAQAAAGRTKLSSTARAWQPVEADAAPPPAAAAPAAGAEPPRARPLEASAPGAPPCAPRFGSSLLRCVEEVLRKSAFVTGVAVSAVAGARWRLQIGMRREHLYLKEHVLACAQEALFDVLDELQALRGRGHPAGRGIPETVFDLRVECPGSS